MPVSPAKLLQMIENTMKALKGPAPKVKPRIFDDKHREYLAEIMNSPSMSGGWFPLSDQTIEKVGKGHTPKKFKFGITEETAFGAHDAPLSISKRLANRQKGNAGQSDKIRVPGELSSDQHRSMDYLIGLLKQLWPQRMGMPLEEGYQQELISKLLHQNPNVTGKVSSKQFGRWPFMKDSPGSEARPESGRRGDLSKRYWMDRWDENPSLQRELPSDMYGPYLGPKQPQWDPARNPQTGEIYPHYRPPKEPDVE